MHVGRNTRAFSDQLAVESACPSDCFLSLMLGSDRRRHPSIGVSCGLISQDGNPTQVVCGSVCIEARGARVFGFTAAALVLTELHVTAGFPSLHHAPVRSPIAANIYKSCSEERWTRWTFTSYTLRKVATLSATLLFFFITVCWSLKWNPQVSKNNGEASTTRFSR
jgi:hypothetical protein